MTLERERTRHPPAVRHATVSAVTSVTPRMLRVTLRGPDLESFSSLGPADHIKVFFPDAQTGTISAPTIGADGSAVRPTGGVVVVRDFTPSTHRVGTSGGAELDIDFFLHDDHGPASSWAAQAAVDDRLVIAGPRVSALAPTGVDHVILVGDETALPAVRRWLFALPPTIPVTCFLFVDDEATRRYLDDAVRVNANVTWFTSERTTDLEAALRALGPLSAETFAFLAGNADALVPLRRYLRRELRLSPDQVAVSGYWRRGVAALDHHAPVDPSDPE